LGIRNGAWGIVRVEATRSQAKIWDGLELGLEARRKERILYGTTFSVMFHNNQPDAMSVLVAGAGVTSGQVIGATDLKSSDILTRLHHL